MPCTSDDPARPCAHLSIMVSALDGSAYPDAGVRIDGRPFRLGLAVPDPLEPGIHRVEVSPPPGVRLARQAFSVALDPGETRTLDIVLTPPGRTFRLPTAAGPPFPVDVPADRLTVAIPARCLERLIFRLRGRGWIARPGPGQEVGPRSEVTPAEVMVEIARDPDRPRDPAPPGDAPVDAAAGSLVELPDVCALVEDVCENARIGIPLRRAGADLGFALTRRALIRFRRDVREDEIASALAGRFSVLRRMGGLENTWLLERSTLDAGVLEDLEAIGADPAVSWSQPDLLLHRVCDRVPNDPLWPGSVHMKVSRCAEAWDAMAASNPKIRGGRRGIRIAIVDDGVDGDHPDLRAFADGARPKVVESVAISAGQATRLPAAPAEHGTACAASAAATADNGIGAAGVAPNCSIIGVALPDSPYESEFIQAMLWVAGLTALDGRPAPLSPAADVISCSWGVNGAPISPAISACFDSVVLKGRSGRGCVMTFSTGNLGLTRFSGIRRYAADHRTIAVGATISTSGGGYVADTRAWYSPFGPEMDIVAPSNPAFRNGVAIRGVSTAIPGNLKATGYAGGSDFDDWFGGTSHATAMVAGAAALVLSVQPELGWAEVREILRRSAVKVDQKIADAEGRWRPAGAPEFSEYYGYGRLDAERAVSLAQRWRPGSDVASLAQTPRGSAMGRAFCGIVTPGPNGTLLIYSDESLQSVVAVREDDVQLTSDLPSGGRTLVRLRPGAQTVNALSG